MPAIHANAPASWTGVPSSANPRAAFAVSVTGLTLAIVWSHCGNVATGTKTELANTRGNVTTNPADCARGDAQRPADDVGRHSRARPRIGTGKAVRLTLAGPA